MTSGLDVLHRLEMTAFARRTDDPDTSYIASLYARGLPAIAQKLGEEATETVIAALAGTDEEVVGEAADLLFHLTVLLAAKDIRMARVFDELARREGTSGLEEKAARSR